MIGKKVRNPGKAGALTVRVHRLADYIDRPESHAPADQADERHDAKAGRVAGLADYTQRPYTGPAREKCIYSGARGFLATERAAQKAEMLGLAQVSAHSKDPIGHYVLSWRAGEQPTPAQVEEAVDLFLDEMELTGHQVFYGLHVDTDNVHLHLMVNRVHPTTRKVVQSNQGFDLEALHRAVARIEHAQGWQREEHGRYRVQADGAVRRDYHSESAQPPTGKRAAGGGHRFHASGAKSAERIAQEEGAPRIRAAASWAELHERLAARGLRYQRKGSGALLWVGDVAVKASRAGRDCSLRAVERRLGDYQPAREGLTVARRLPEPDGRPNAARWAEYHAARGCYDAGKRNDTRALQDRQTAERLTLSAAHRMQRDALFQSVPPGGWRGRGGELNARRSLLAARQAGERAALRERQQNERVALRARWRGGFPSYDAWRRERESPQEAHRRRARLIAVVVEIDDSAASLQAHDIRAFVAVVYGRRVDYRRADNTSGLPGFVDRGREIVIHADHDRDTVLAALQLAAQKWGRFQVEGDAAYQALCVSLAAEHGFRLGNPELQAALQQARAARMEKRTGLAPR